MTRSYKGLTWDHPRGYNALAAAAARLSEHDDLAIDWDKQPLEGFESAPIADLCERYDLVVLDHPHIGEAFAQDCLTPIDAILPADALEKISSAAIGASLRSYHYEGRLWALPLDAATQVAASRRDLLDAAVPTTWPEVLDLSKSGKIAMSAAGPHALLSFGSVCVALGASPGLDDAYIGTEPGLDALDILAGLYAQTPAAVLNLNPIGILQLMATGDEVAYCPLIYGYVNYAAPDDPGHRPIAFADAPAGQGGIGSTLGGTGLAVSHRTEISEALIRHLLWLMSETAQCDFIPAHDGQPSLRRAWTDKAVNARWGNFYRNTEATLEAAWVRPRFDGYIAFQTAASALLREGFATSRPHRELLDHLNRLYRNHRPQAGRPGAAL